MAIIIPVLFFMLLPLIFIGVGYYFDYKHDKRDFVATLKKMARELLKLAAVTAIITIGGKFIYQLFPLDHDYGKSYNATRAEASIPLIEAEWKLAEHAGNRYTQWWMDSTDSDRRTHTLKIINYNLLGPTQEFDYFSNPAASFRLESQYDYQSNSMSYRIIKPKTGAYFNFAATQPHPDEIVTSIMKEEFDKILRDWQLHRQGAAKQEMGVVQRGAQ
ncbi:hypothetical protein [uncultured Pontibacter sp.]|uniref:hypothetical protein n=1 Tax=uncultured Pontibacter sp. TaxID=453356 RepID=UPI0026075030|nr:hypothetical protein [uncultured Pontibacter sp.]